MFHRYFKKRHSLFEDLDPSRIYHASIPAVFVTGVGRSGTHLMASLSAKHPDVSAYHMDDIGDAVGDSFIFYSKWNRQPMDYTGLIQSRTYLMEQSSKKGKKIYLEANPMLALSLEDLNRAFEARFIFMIRHPRQVVESHYQKGWYSMVPKLKSNKIPAYHYYFQKSNHFFSRIMPLDESDRQEWLSMSRAGRIAWMCKVINESILNQLRTMASSQYKIVYLNTFHYNEYCQLAGFINFPGILTKTEFDKIMLTRPGKGPPLKEKIWNDKSIADYNRQISQMIPLFSFLKESETWTIGES